jgi:hypothetical protein
MGRGHGHAPKQYKSHDRPVERLENAQAFGRQLCGDVIGVPAAVSFDPAVCITVLYNDASYRVELGVDDRPQVGVG